MNLLESLWEVGEQSDSEQPHPSALFEELEEYEEGLPPEESSILSLPLEDQDSVDDQRSRASVELGSPPRTQQQQSPAGSALSLNLNLDLHPHLQLRRHLLYLRLHQDLDLYDFSPNYCGPCSCFSPLISC